MRLATPPKLQNRKPEICPLFFLGNFSGFATGLKFGFLRNGGNGEMIAKMQSYPQAKIYFVYFFLFLLISREANVLIIKGESWVTRSYWDGKRSYWDYSESLHDIKLRMGNALNASKSKAKIDEHHVQLGEIADGIYGANTLKNPPSLRTLKLQDILMKSAGANICEDRWHQFDLSVLKNTKGLGNLPHSEIVLLFEELRRATITNPNYEKGYTEIYGLIGAGKVEFVERGVVKFKFDEIFREVMERSNLYAVLDRTTSLALSSRYAHRLHEMIALRSGRDHSTERFTVADLRGRMGVQTGKLAEWSAFKRFALQKAVDEVNQLSRFGVTWRVCKKYRRRVEEVEIAWKTKRDLVSTKQELNRAKPGRKERQNGSAETPVMAFPASGGIRFVEPWQGIAKTHGSGKDINLIGKDFRNWCAGKNIPLDGPKISRQFETFCKGVSL